MKRIALFAGLVNYGNSRRLDHYLSEIARHFALLGFGVDIYAANEYTRNGGNYGLSKNINFVKLDKLINSKNYVLLLSINNALMTERLECLSKIPLIDLVVDDFNHLFKHDQCSIYEQFNLAKYIIFSSYSHINRLKKNNPILKGRIHFYPTATSAFNRSTDQLNLPKKYNIAWIATLLDVSGISLMFQQCIDYQDKVNLLRNAVQCVKDGHHIHYDERLGESSLDTIITEYKWTRAHFEMQVQNLISNDSRITVANDLHRFGLHIFGNREWTSAAAYHPKIMDVYHDGGKISSHDDIMRIYNSSKICINSSQVQTESALPYRVIDILASDALLITNYHPESDAFAIFGKDCPIVMYKNIDDLVHLCDYYLAHEDERLILVERCNDLVKNGFEFKDRCKDILKLAGVSYEGNTSDTGNLKYINSNTFISNGVKIKVRFKSGVVRLVKYLLKIIPFALRRSLLINLRN
jgi:hypothetical protein